VNPGEVELTCDGIENDCDPLTTDGPDGDGDGSPTCLDCDDADPANFPGNPELCDARDNNCSGTADETVVFQSWFLDDDGDGFGTSLSPEIISCAPIPGRVADDTDCDDTDSLVSPAGTEITCDGLENDCNLATEDEPDNDGDGVVECLDCDDADELNFPGNVELCDGADNNCNTTIDDGISFVDYYPDLDGDGHGDPSGTPINACTAPPPGTSSLADDCDDGDADNFPSNPEICDGADNDCDAQGAIDNGLTFTSFYLDLDGDGYGNVFSPPTATCDGAPPGQVANQRTDCNDSNDVVNPGQPEATCNLVDDDCTPATPDAPDLDNDGVSACFECDDNDPDNYLGNNEVCDGADNDCDGNADDGLTFVAYYRDLDGDGHGNPASQPVSTCSGPPAGYVALADDCADNAPNRFPGNPEICDGVDNDCSAATLDAPDGDGDGASMCVDCQDNNPNNRPGGTEVCDGADNDCDTLLDDGLTFVNYYPDVDNDNHGADDRPAVSRCNGAPANHVVSSDDCDDNDVGNFPGNNEVCDGADDDCDAVADDGLAFVTWYPGQRRRQLRLRRLAGGRHLQRRAAQPRRQQPGLQRQQLRRQARRHRGHRQRRGRELRRGRQLLARPRRRRRRHGHPRSRAARSTALAPTSRT
jgi:hypothetical protein